MHFFKTVEWHRMKEHKRNEYIRQEYGITDINKIIKRAIRTNFLNTVKEWLPKIESQSYSVNIYRKEKGVSGIQQIWGPFLFF
jgi:hypothetical protein